MKTIKTMKHTGIIIAVIFLLPFLVTTTYAQKTRGNTYSEKGDKSKVDPNNQKKRGISYENFELTDENLEWAKLEIEKEKERAETDIKEGRITVDEYEERLANIAKAERKVKEFEIKRSEIPKKDDNDPSSVKNEDDKTGGEFVSQKDLEEQKRNARAERDKKRREANKAKANANRGQGDLERINQEKIRLEQQKKDGKITDKEYNERMSRLLQAEENMKKRDAAAEKQAKDKEEASGGINADRENNKEADQQKSEQERKNQASEIKDQKGIDLKKTVVAGDEKIIAAKERILKEKEKLEKDKKNRKISDQQYKAKMEKIERAEKALRDLEQKVRQGKSVEDK